MSTATYPENFPDCGKNAAILTAAVQADPVFCVKTKYKTWPLWTAKKMEIWSDSPVPTSPVRLPLPQKYPRRNARVSLSYLG